VLRDRQGSDKLSLGLVSMTKVGDCTTVRQAEEREARLEARTERRPTAKRYSPMRLPRAIAIASLALLAACAELPLSRGGGFRGTSPLSLAPTSGLARAARDPAQCYDLLKAEGVVFTPLQDRMDGEFCDVRDALTLAANPTALSPARPMMTCGLAAAFLMWTRQSVAPAAREILGSELRQIDHFGVYACRRVNGAQQGRPSAHARADAIDVAGFRLANGRRVTVLADWRKDGPEAAFLHRIRDDGCRVFGTVLSPDYNALHANHLHLEGAGERGPCG
jgi:hypothetical protein